MMRLDLLPKIRGDCFNFSEQVFSAIQVAKTSSELVHEKKRFNFSLFRYNYGGGTAKENQKKVLLVPQIINRPYILDLNDDVSVVRRFCERDFDVFLIDWGYPTIEHRDISFTHYVQYVDYAIDLISREKMSILGYCTGGIISLVYASLHPEKIQNLIQLATPVDFSKWYDPRITWGKLFDANTVAFYFGNIPGELVDLIGFQLLAWYMPLFSTNLEFWKEFLIYESWRDIWRRLRWVTDAQAIPTTAYFQFIEGCYKENLLIKNKLRVDSQLVDLNKIRSPLLNILARYDHIVPLESVKALKGVYCGDEYEEIIFPSSHVGLSAGSKAHKELWPRVCDWLQARS